MTTRTKSPYSDRAEASLLALRLLKLTLKILGPVNGGFDKAFEFKHFETGLTRHGRGERDLSSTGLTRLAAFPEQAGQVNGIDPDNLVDGELRNDLARTSSLWVRAEDFWACVGWALNCSILRLKNGPTAHMYEKRWERWRLWLEFMLDLMEEDWKVRETDPPKDPADDDDVIVVSDEIQARKERLKRSLIYKFIITSSGDYGRDRRIVRSIFANGDTKSTNEFREIFKNELKEPKKDAKSESKLETAPKVNIEEDIYGDYVGGPDDEDDEDEEPADHGRSARPKRNKRTALRDVNSTTESDTDIDATSSDVPNGAASFGSTDSLILRLRLMSLLIGVSIHLQSPETGSWTRTTIIDTTSLMDLLTEFTKFLPLPLFAALLNPTLALPYFQPNYYSALCENLLFRLLEPATPQTDEPNLTQRKLQTCFLPFAANSTNAVDNAKVSLILEGLLRTMARGEGYLKYRDSLEKAVEDGIIRREGKVKRKTGEDMIWTALKESSARIRDILQNLKHV